MMDEATDILGGIAAMRSQEETISCFNYFASTTCQESGVDETCRASMVDWYRAIQREARLRPETVWSAASYLDRYLSSGKGRSHEALGDRYAFQLASIGAFYLAVKLHERHVSLDARKLAEICKGYYPIADILAIEEDMLFALDWKVVMTPTPMDFVRHLSKLLPKEVDKSTERGLIRAARRHVGHAASDFCLSFYPPSSIGAGCLASALLELDILETNERQDLWTQLAETADLIDIMEVQNRLLENKDKPRRRVADSRPTHDAKKKKKHPKSRSRRAAAASRSRASSPVCIIARRPTVESVGTEATVDSLRSSIASIDLSR